MSDANEPRRLLDDPSTREALRDALEAARDDVPTDAELASLASRLGPMLLPPGGGGGGGGGGAPGASTAALGAKALGILAAAAALGGVVWGGIGWWAASPAAPPTGPRTPPVHREARAPTEPAPPILPDGIDPPSAEEEPRAVGTSAGTGPRHVERAAPRHEVDPEAELALLRRAQDALRSDPARALALTDEHRRRFGEGTLEQEREVVAVDALVRLGREAAARRRADAFRARWPRSAHRRRLDVLVPATRDP